MKHLIQRQYCEIVDKAAAQLKGLRLPGEGWLRTAREAMGMSAAQLARRIGTSRARVSRVEKQELSGGVTLRSMESLAAAMGCRFVYAIVPEGKVEDLVAERALQKARQMLERSHILMALEGQTLSPAQQEYELARLKAEILRDRPADFWDDN